MSLYTLLGALEIGLIFSLVALGVYISFRLLRFPDLTVDGSFPLGGAVAATLIAAGTDPFVATFAAMIAGAGAGLITGWLNVRLKIMDLLASILMMIALYSINLRVMGKPNVPLIMEPTVFNILQPEALADYVFRPLLLVFVVLAVKLLLDGFFATQTGLAIRATGSNARMARAQGVNTGMAVLAGMAVSNALVGLAGALFAQTQGGADISMGVGTIVIGLAAVIVGESLLPSRKLYLATLAVIVGAIVYRFFIAVALNSDFFGLLVLGLMVGMGLVGFLDDYIKIVKRRSLGLRAKAKMAGQLIVGISFAVLALMFPDSRGNTPASTKLSFITDFGWSIGPVLFVIWALFMILAMSNGVNLTDGLDGLATGASVLVFGAYTFIGVWQYQESCANAQTLTNPAACYEVRDPLDLAVVASALMGACLGFLWWNTSPEKIFMGDTGSLALGGVLTGLAILSRTELLVAIMGGLFVLITMSVVIQVGSFRLTGKRVFRMAPLQHHFELKGWSEVLVVVRFWIIQGICVIVGLGLFYAGWAAEK